MVWLPQLLTAGLTGAPTQTQPTPHRLVLWGLTWLRWYVLTCSISPSKDLPLSYSLGILIFRRMPQGCSPGFHPNPESCRLPLLMESLCLIFPMTFPRTWAIPASHSLNKNGGNPRPLMRTGAFFYSWQFPPCPLIRLYPTWKLFTILRFLYPCCMTKCYV